MTVRFIACSIRRAASAVLAPRPATFNSSLSEELSVQRHPIDSGRLRASSQPRTAGDHATRGHPRLRRGHTPPEEGCRQDHREQDGSNEDTESSSSRLQRAGKDDRVVTEQAGLGRVRRSIHTDRRKPSDDRCHRDPRRRLTGMQKYRKHHQWTDPGRRIEEYLRRVGENRLRGNRNCGQIGSGLNLRQPAPTHRKASPANHDIRRREDWNGEEPEQRQSHETCQNTTSRRDDPQAGRRLKGDPSRQTNERTVEPAGALEIRDRLSLEPPGAKRGSEQACEARHRQRR